MDRLSFMRAFCRIVELNSFSRAAEDLGLSTALLSRETRLLEESLGCVLLSRTTRSMTLTDNGKLYYDECRRILEDVGALDAALRAGAGVVRGRLKVNAPLSFGLSVLSPMLPAFLARYPEIDIALTLDDRVIDMVEGGHDVSIRVRAELPDSSLVARRLATVDQRLYASPAYLDAQGRPQTPEDLKSHRICAFTLADHATVWALSDGAGQQRLAIQPRHTVSNSLFLRDMLEAGQGIGALPGFLAREAVAAKRLERVLPDHALPDRHVFAVLAARLGADAKTRAFLSFVEEALAGTGPSRP